MKKYVFLAACFLMSMNTFAQQKETAKAKDVYSMPSQDYFMIQIGYDNWLNAPDSFNINGIGRSFSAYLCYDFPMQKTNFSFAAGVGIGTSNIYFKDKELILNDTSSTQIYVRDEMLPYKKYKMTLGYVEAPFEFRYFGNKNNRNKGFKAAVGVKVGALISAHTKGKYTLNGKTFNEKVVTKRYIETWKMAPTLRLGYGNFSIYGSYQVSNLFRLGSGPEGVTPVSIGICISGL